jgi:hypothetical protein
MRIHFPFTALLLLLSLTTQAQFIDWSTRFGGNEYDLVSDVGFDSENNLYVTGSFTGTAEFNYGGIAHSLTSSGGGDMFLLKLNPAGELIWVRQIGGPQLDYGERLAIDSDNNIVVIGRFSGNVDFDPSDESYYIPSVIPSAEYVCMLNSNGEFLWANKISGLQFQDVTLKRVALDGYNRVVVTGSFLEEVHLYQDPNATGVILQNDGNPGNFYALFSQNGELLEASVIGTNGTPAIYSMNLDNNGNLLLAGAYYEHLSFGDEDENTLSSNGHTDIFISKYNTDGQLDWVKSFGGIEEDYCLDAISDEYGNIYHTGVISSTVSFEEGNPDLTLATLGNKSIYISMLSPDGAPQWAEQIVSNNEFIYSQLVLDQSNNVLVSGYFAGKLFFNIENDIDSLISDFGSSTFLAKYNTEGTFIWAKIIAGETFARATTMAVDHTNNIYLAGKFHGTMYDGPPSDGYALQSCDYWDGFVLRINHSNPVNIEETSVLEKISVYPSPAHSIVHIETEALIRSVEIYNMVGNLVGIETTNRITVNHLSNGVYVMRVETENGCSMVRFVKD